MNPHTETHLDVEFKTSFISNIITKKPKHPGRNDLCHCNSGKKYKKCCLDKDIEEDREAKRYKPPPRDPNAPKISASGLIALSSSIRMMAGIP
jgi:hypothetical protein